MPRHRDATSHRRRKRRRPLPEPEHVADRDELDAWLATHSTTENRSSTMTDTIAARTLSCTALQCCDSRDVDAVTWHGIPVTGYRAEVERRGEEHVFSCAGIYPTGYSPDGTAQYSNPVCTAHHPECTAART